MDVVAETGDGQQAAELWKKHRPDITLMDLRMPGLDGVNAIYQIRAADPSARIIVLTTYDGDEDIYRGMRALQRPRAANKATRRKCCFHETFADLDLAVVALSEILRKISQNFSPAGVTSPFVARAMPTDATSVVPVSGR